MYARNDSFPKDGNNKLEHYNEGYWLQSTLFHSPLEKL